MFKNTHQSPPQILKGNAMNVENERTMASAFLALSAHLKVRREAPSARGVLDMTHARA